MGLPSRNNGFWQLNMCGIAAILLHQQERNAEQWQAIKNAFTQNLIFNEERGNAATGMAILDIKGGVELYKSALAATDYVGTPEYKKMLTHIGKQTTLILGHTRQPTKGTPSDNDNNHPLQTGPVFGVHNGHIENDDELFTKFGYVRTAKVDSEIIFRLIGNASPQVHYNQYLNKIRNLLEYMQGQYTFLACDQRSPQQLLVLKHGNPLCIHFHRQWNALVFSSRYVFLRKTFGATLITESLEANQLMLFDARIIPEMGISPKLKAPVDTRGITNGM